MKTVEQVSMEGRMVRAHDEVLTPAEIRGVLARHLTVLHAKNPFEVSFRGRRFKLCVKNVSYLGHPHPIHKKRIQIPGAWRPVLREQGTLLMGIYTHAGRHLFVLFDAARYRRNRIHNSSAHVHTIDLLQARKYGQFKKVDSRGNRIVVCTERELENVLALLCEGKDIRLAPELAVIDSFCSQVDARWEGRSSYRDMVADNFPDALQAEWPGFYLEYRFSKFLGENPDLKNMCRYEKNKKGGDLDFDLDFHGAFLGDLKMHDRQSGSVLGNDRRSIAAALKRHQRFWYVVINHTSVKDSMCGHRVTRFWNRLLATHRGTQKDPLSYGGKMKSSVTLVDVMVAEVNRHNRAHLREFRQGRNSRGEPRAPKVKIDTRDLDNFLIYRKTLLA